MQSGNEITKGEREQLENLRQMEDLASKKAGIYSRLLIDAQLAQKMEQLEKRHKEREMALKALLYGKEKKAKSMGQVRGEEK